MRSTAILRKKRLALTTRELDFFNASSVQLEPSGQRLFLSPSDAGPHAIRDKHLAFSDEDLSALGWAEGAVVEKTIEDGRIMVEQVAEPLDAALNGQDEHGVPIPPGWLTQTVVNNSDALAFAKSGEHVGRFFADLFVQHAGGAERLLDFGCGCGRLARVLPRMLGCSVSGCDLQTAAVEWCRRNLEGDFRQGVEWPPMEWPDGAFDSLTAVSVLTHLDEDHQFKWLEEWRRLVAPGGVLLVTFRSDRYIAKAEKDAAKADALRSKGFIYQNLGFWEGIFPQFYGGTYHTDDYIRENWGRYFDVHEIISCGTGPMIQDLAVMKRR